MNLKLQHRLLLVILLLNLESRLLIIIKTEVKIIVVSIIADEIGCNPSALQGEELLIDLGIDSLGMLNIIWETQDFFQIEFNIEDALINFDMMTVDTYVDIVYHFCLSDGDYTG